MLVHPLTLLEIQHKRVARNIKVFIDLIVQLKVPITGISLHLLPELLDHQIRIRLLRQAEVYAGPLLLAAAVLYHWGLCSYAYSFRWVRRRYNINRFQLRESLLLFLRKFRPPLLFFLLSLLARLYYLHFPYLFWRGHMNRSFPQGRAFRLHLVVSNVVYLLGPEVIDLPLFRREYQRAVPVLNQRTHDGLARAITASCVQFEADVLQLLVQ